MPWSPRRRVLPTLLVAIWALSAATEAVASTLPARGSEAPTTISVMFLPAHAQLVGTTPKDASTVRTATEVMLSFNEDVNPDFVKVAVKGPAGEETDGDPVVDKRDVTQALSSDLPAGTHRVAYRVVSTDGHPVSGTIEFATTLAPAPSESASASSTASPSSTPTASAAQSPEGTPSTAPTPGGEETVASGPSTWQWAGIGAAAVALLAIFIIMAARSDRSASGDHSV